MDSVNMKRKTLHIEESTAQDFRLLSRACNCDQSKLLRVLMSSGTYKETTTFEPNAKILNRLEGE
jgi:hypothetical protein